MSGTKKEIVEEMISIIVTAYNIELYVGTCLKSIINQTYKNLQIIVINDGSTDNTGKICEYFGKKDKRIELISQTNKGVSAARNAGIDLAKGDYLMFIDGDDIIECDMVEKLYHLLKCKNNIFMSTCGYHKIKIKKKNIKRYNIGNKVINNEYIYYIKNYRRKNKVAKQNTYKIKFTHKKNKITKQSVDDNRLDFNYKLENGQEAIKDIYVSRIISTSIWGKLFDASLFNDKDIRFRTDLTYGEDIVFLIELILKMACDKKNIAITDKKLYNYVKRNDSLLHRKKIDKTYMDLYYSGKMQRDMLHNSIKLSDLQKKMADHVPYIMLLKIYVQLKRNEICDFQRYRIGHARKKTSDNDRIIDINQILIDLQEEFKIYKNYTYRKKKYLIMGKLVILIYFIIEKIVIK